MGCVPQRPSHVDVQLGVPEALGLEELQRGLVVRLRVHEDLLHAPRHNVPA
jgi:hypothetical protein